MSPSRPFRDRLGDKLPEILLEAGSVVFAILLAFIVQEWRQDRQNEDLAARARQGILIELRANHEDLRRNMAASRLLLERLPILAGAAEADTLTSLEVNLSLAELTTSAWRTAQASEAAVFLDYEWLLDVAKAYELQALYTQGQQELVTRLGGPEGTAARWLRVLERGLALNQRIGEQLEAAYDSLLDDAAEMRL